MPLRKSGPLEAIPHDVGGRETEGATLRRIADRLVAPGTLVLSEDDAIHAAAVLHELADRKDGRNGRRFVIEYQDPEQDGRYGLLLFGVADGQPETAAGEALRQLATQRASNIPANVYALEGHDPVARLIVRPASDVEVRPW